MRISFSIKNVLPLLVSFTLFPSPAFAGGLNISGGFMIMACIVIMVPGLLVAFTLTKGDAKTRLQAALATLFISSFFAPVLFVGVLFGGWLGVAIAAIVPFAIGQYMSHPKKAGEKSTAQSVGERFNSIFFPLLIAVALWAAYKFADEVHWRYTHGEWPWGPARDPGPR